MIYHDLIIDIALTPIENPTAKVVLLALASYSNSRGECFPSRSLLAEKSCTSVRSVVTALQWLEANEFIQIKHRGGSSNFYVITSMEEEMSDDTRAKSAHEVDSNISKIDFSKGNKTITTTRAKSAHPRDTPLFSAFWQAYPRRIGKGAARAAFERATKFADANDLVQAAIKFSEHCQETGKEPQYIPHPSTWLNQERWEDDLEAETTATRKQEKWIDEL